MSTDRYIFVLCMHFGNVLDLGATMFAIAKNLYEICIKDLPITFVLCVLCERIGKLALYMLVSIVHLHDMSRGGLCIHQHVLFDPFLYSCNP